MTEMLKQQFIEVKLTIYLFSFILIILVRLFESPLGVCNPLVGICDQDAEEEYEKL